MANCSNKLLIEAAQSLRILFGNGGAASSIDIWASSVEPQLLRALSEAFASAGQSDMEFKTAEVLNFLLSLTPQRGILEVLEDGFFEMLLTRRLDIADYLKKNSPAFSQIEFFRNNFLSVEKGIGILRELPDSQYLNPAVRGCLAGQSVLNGPAEKIVEIALMRDPFSRCRTFRYLNGIFKPCPIKEYPVNKFYGFHGVRSRFQEHLSDFASGRGNVPLLISSLPGLGKTQFSINYTLAEQNLTLIFAEPETLEQDLDKLIAALALRKRRKFVVFFDDIEPERINWYSFRTNVGGSALLPGNITFILASNYTFPINILSRGREITFPVFDEVRCLEMVEDFLADFGMKNANENLASVIGAGYIEDFGQKKFTELSPRTLIRYLEKFRNDAALRRKMMEQSKQEMIIRPDSQLFYEFNIKLLRQLYGESFIDEMREEQLRSIGKA